MDSAHFAATLQISTHPHSLKPSWHTPSSSCSTIFGTCGRYGTSGTRNVITLSSHSLGVEQSSLSRTHPATPPPPRRQGKDPWMARLWWANNFFFDGSGLGNSGQGYSGQRGARLGNNPPAVPHASLILEVETAFESGSPLRFFFFFFT